MKTTKINGTTYNVDAMKKQTKKYFVESHPHVLDASEIYDKIVGKEKVEEVVEPAAKIEPKKNTFKSDN